VVHVGEAAIGSSRICIAAGPCSVESEEQICHIAEQVKQSGATLLRGGAFKPRTSPYAFQGLKAEGLMFMKRARQATGLPVVSEITNPAQLELFLEFVDVIQVGTRNMQNFELLKELGRVRRPILLKRGFANTLDELLMSAEYIMSGGNQDVILCERGIRTFESSTRNTLDISAIPVLKSRTHLPVFVDPSHAGGIAWLVEPLAKASVAAGADGLIIEVHNDPKRALSDGQQSLTPDSFHELVERLRPIAVAVGREI
jgi:3-deoxy-7-phosphoheptulonate synthase